MKRSQFLQEKKSSEEINLQTQFSVWEMRERGGYGFLVPSSKKEMGKLYLAYKHHFLSFTYQI